MTTSIRILKSLPHQMNTINQIYTDKYLIKRTVFDNYKYNFLCWKSKCLRNLYFNEYSYNRKIFTLDFNITKDILKIKHLSINNDYNDKTSITYHQNLYDYDKNKVLLTQEESNEVKRFVFDFIYDTAIEKNINKVAIDINSDLRRYNCELESEGFVPNYDNKCYSNPAWIQAEKIIYKNNSLIINNKDK
jgi:hypothetical protein